MAMARQQTLVQLNDELLYALDQRAVKDRRSRSFVIREALAQYLHDEIEAEISRQIVEGYTRIPQTEEELVWAEENGRRMVAEEPW